MHTTGSLIADTYTLGTGPWTITPVTRGALGQIWRLAGPASSWAVKELLFECDAEQVERESALRDAAEALGISAPRLMANRAGTHVSRLDPSVGGSHVKVYDWVDGTKADPSDPEVLRWCGQTLAILHRAGEGATDTPDSWYEACRGEGEWARLYDNVRRAGPTWADALERFIDTSAAELSACVTPSGSDDIVTSHLDMQPQNVLIGPAGPVLLDWDNAATVSAERELARAVYVWSGGNDFRADSARQLVRAYRDFGGRAGVKGLEPFSMLFATALNYVYVQAECAIDPNVTAEQRAFAGDQVVTSLRSLPEPTAVSRLLETVAAI